MSEIAKSIKCAMLLVFFIGWLTGSIHFASYNSIEDQRAGHTGCVYQSVLGVINVPYVLACELIRKRF